MCSCRGRVVWGELMCVLVCQWRGGIFGIFGNISVIPVLPEEWCGHRCRKHRFNRGAARVYTYCCGPLTHRSVYAIQFVSSNTLKPFLPARSERTGCLLPRHKPQFDQTRNFVLSLKRKTVNNLSCTCSVFMLNWVKHKSSSGFDFLFMASDKTCSIHLETVTETICILTQQHCCHAWALKPFFGLRQSIRCRG